MNTLNEIESVLREVLPDQRNPLVEPCLQGNELSYLKECVDTNFVSSVGKFVDRFSSQLSEYTGLSKAVPVVNGTSALSMCYKLVGVKPGDEVMMPAMTFVATANAAKYLNATPHFVDSSLDDLGVDVTKLKIYFESNLDVRNGAAFNKKTNRKISAFVVMHTFGHISPQILKLTKLLDEYSIPLVEDAAEALGSFMDGHHAGHWGRISALSFNGNKIVTTGGGGAIITNNFELGDFAKHLTTTAKQQHPWRYYHDEVGYNYRMPNINAALGCAQLEQLPFFLKVKKKIQKRYETAFSAIDGVRMIVAPEKSDSNYWLPALLLPENKGVDLSGCMDQLNEAGFCVRPVWDLMHTLPMYRDCPRMNLNNAIELASRIVCLPSSVSLGEWI